MREAKKVPKKFKGIVREWICYEKTDSPEIQEKTGKATTDVL